MVPIAKMGHVAGIAPKAPAYTGCCYDPASRACPCGTRDEEAACGLSRDGSLWADAGEATTLGVTCASGTFETLRPKWYEFAGGAPDRTTTFAWDSTCEAEGTGPKDSGLHAARWHLKGGTDYVLRIYPREDGTAVDAIVLAPVGADVPTVLKAGDSFACRRKASSPTRPTTDDPTPFWTVSLILLIAAALLASLALACVLVPKARRAYDTWRRTEAPSYRGMPTLEPTLSHPV